jgi:nucleoside-diphosphate-sugar epimerase
MTAPDALIGHSGFIGTTLQRSRRFDALFNSTNREEAQNREFDLLVCAGASSLKWFANAHPAEDRAQIDRLVQTLGRVQAQKVILISTIEVYPDKTGVDESTPIDSSRLEPYGRHRRELEAFVQAQFATALIVRLPGVFGPGLKKNVIYDLLHGNYSYASASTSQLQFYDVRRLWSDLQVACGRRLPIVNIATEPVSLGDIAAICADAGAGGVRYGTGVVQHDMCTNYAHEWRRTGRYLYSREEVLDDLRSFATESAGRPSTARRC